RPAPNSVIPLEFEDLVRGEMLEDEGIGRREAPAAEARVRDEQAIEHVPGPTDVEGGLEPGGGRRVILYPPVIAKKLLWRRAAAEIQSARFGKDLQLEYRRRRDVQRPLVALERRGPRMPVVEPDDGIRVEQDHRFFVFFRRLLKRMRPGAQSHVHWPASTAGSIHA